MWERDTVLTNVRCHVSTLMPVVYVYVSDSESKAVPNRKVMDEYLTSLIKVLT